MERSTLREIVTAHGAQHVVDTLRPYLTEARQQRIEYVLKGRMGEVAAAVESPSDPHNAAAVVRTAEALGALNVHVVAGEGRALHAKATTQGAYHWVHTHHHADFDEFLAVVRRRGMALCGAWMDAPLALQELPCDQPICLLFGNESRGLSQQARAACDFGFHVPMFGMSESLNLSVTAAIALHDLLQRRRATLGASDLTDTQRAVLRAEYYVGSVDERLCTGLLPAMLPASKETSA